MLQLLDELASVKQIFMKHIRKLTTRTNNRSVSIIQKSAPAIPKKIINIKRNPISFVSNNSVVKTAAVSVDSQSLIENTLNGTLINIITRTSGRPVAFKRCFESVKNQTYTNIRHLVSIDSLSDKAYVESCTSDYIFIDKAKIEAQQDIPDPKTGKRFIYNLYFNELIAKITDGWILILDDDDYLINSSVITTIVKSIKNTTDMLLFQMKYPTDELLPTLQEMNGKPRLGRIGSPCILIHSAIAKTIKWDGWKCGDYRYISRAWDKTSEKIWLKFPMIQLGGAGFGLRKDAVAPVEVMAKSNNVAISASKDIGIGGRNHVENQKILGGFQKRFSGNSVVTTIAKPVQTVQPKVLNPIIGGISILISAYKSSNFIEECLNSIEQQTYFINNDNFEVIVGVDACNDTYNRLLRIKNNYRNLTVVLLEKNVGTYVTMNTIIPISSFPNIIRFDSDDVMKNHMISDIMSSENVFDIIRFKFTQFEGKVANISKNITKKIYAVGVLFFKRKVFELCGGYANSRFSSDSELLIRAEKFTKTKFIDKELFYYRRHQNSLSFTVPSAERRAFDSKTNKTTYTSTNVKIKPVTSKIKTMTTSRQFNQEVKNFIKRIEEDKPFSIVRYGDGEMMIIENKPIDLSNKHNGEHKFIPEDINYQKLRNEMSESIRFKSDNYFVGLPCPCCVNNESVVKLLKIAQQNEKNITWANIFVNSNFKIFNELFFKAIKNKNKNIVLVCHEKANTDVFKSTYNVIKEFRVGKNAWINNYSKIEDIKTFSKEVAPNTIFLFMAGTFTKLAIFNIHKLRQDLFLLDLGSTMDLQFALGETRNYLKPNSQNSNKICKWIIQ